MCIFKGLGHSKTTKFPWAKVSQEDEPKSREGKRHTSLLSKTAQGKECGCEVRGREGTGPLIQSITSTIIITW